MTNAVLHDYDRFPFTAPIKGTDRTFDVYRRGEGPPIVLMQELPGLGRPTLRFADDLVQAGFQVCMPHLFGPLGRSDARGNLVRVMCMRREFQIFAKNKSMGITEWLRALCQQIRVDTGAPGVGVVGMCLSGSFAMTLIADDAVLAAVASQPALPPKQSALQLSSDEIAASRAALEQKGAMHAFRFEGDWMCKAKKFDAIDRAFNDQEMRRIELHALPGNGHSVFTIDFDTEDDTGPTGQALRTIISYFHDRLGSS